MTQKLPEHLPPRMLAILEETYQAGFRDGCAYTRAAIMRAASMPEDAASAAVVQAAPASSSGGERAPRRAARNAVQIMLQRQPGLTVQEMENLLPSIDPTVARRTIGGELYRQKDRLYEQQGSRWFLKGAESASGASGSAGAGAPASETENREGYDAAA